MPPHRHHPPPPPPPAQRHRHVPPSAISAFIDVDYLQTLLAPWVPEPEDRAFVVRCLVQEGPAHHRGANYVILSLLGEVLARLDPKITVDQNSAPLPMRLPPHLERHHDEANFPLELPLSPLKGLAEENGRHADAMVDCLTDGPPQHAVANVAMVCLLGAILDAIPEKKT